MNRRLIVVFAFALIVASVTSFLIYRVIVSHVQSPGRAALPSNTLVIAVHDLQVGALIHESGVKQVSWAGSIPDQVIPKVQDAAGRGLSATIYQNGPIVSERLAAKGAGAG